MKKALSIIGKVIFWFIIIVFAILYFGGLSKKDTALIVVGLLGITAATLIRFAIMSIKKSKTDENYSNVVSDRKNSALSFKQFAVLLALTVIFVVSMVYVNSSKKTSDSESISESSNETAISNEETVNSIISDDTEEELYNPYKTYTEVSKAVNGVASFEYGWGCLDSSYDSILKQIVPEDTLEDWDNTCEYVLNKTKVYLQSIDSIDELFSDMEKDDDYSAIRLILGIAFANSKDKKILSHYDTTSDKFKEQKELVKQLSSVKQFFAGTSDFYIEEINENPMRTKEKYKDNFVFINGRVNNIDASGEYFSITSLTDDYSFTTILCNIKNDSVKEAIMNIGIGDTITVAGVVKDVGEILGYTIDVYSVR